MIMTALAGLGIDFVTNLIKDKGEDLVTAGIKKVTGIDLTKKELTPEEVQRIKDHELAIMRLDFDKLKLELDAEKEANRHDEATAALEHGNTANARGMNAEIQKSEHASNLAKVAAYYIDFAVIAGAFLMAIMLFFVDIPPANKELAYMTFGSLLTLAGAIVNYHRGSSAGSDKKNSFFMRDSK